MRKNLILSAVGCIGLALSGCAMDKMIGKQVTTHGYQFNPQMLELVPEGSSREQVLLALGTPNTTLTDPSGNETFYYITQKKSRAAAFTRPKIIEQTVMAVYFGGDDTVRRISNYGLQDGRVFDFSRKVTPSGGKELTLIGQLLRASQSVVNPFGG